MSLGLHNVLHNNVQVFNLTSGRSLPEWLAERRRDKKLSDKETAIELVHNFEFPTYAQCLFRCPNGTHFFAAGGYPSRVRCYDANLMSMKFEFNADIEIHGGVSLSPDYRKFALRNEGRQITLHNAAVIVDRLKVPHLQRDLVFHENTCELLSCGASDTVHRFSLDSGCFIEGFRTGTRRGGVNAVRVARTHGLVLAGCDNGVVEAWDPRAAGGASLDATGVHTRPAGVVNVGCADFAGSYSGPLVSALENAGRPAVGESCAVTCIDVDDGTGGYTFACGTSVGIVALYDIRMSRPLMTKDHMSGLPIVRTYFYAGQGAGQGSGRGGHVVSADTGAVRVWSREDGANFTTVEAPAKIHDFMFFKARHNLAPPYESVDSGVIAIACDCPRVQVSYLPALGRAPRWASFLDTITENMTAVQTESVVYDDYKFISKEEMDRLGVTANDISDGRVRPAMHGAFIEARLYNDLMAVVDPSGHRKQLMEAAQKAMQNRVGERISKFKRIEQDADKSGAALDPRFAAKLRDPAFAMGDKKTEYAQLLKAVEERKTRELERQKKHDTEQFHVVSVEPVSKGENREADGENDGVILEELRPGSKFTASSREAHQIRKGERRKKLTLEERLKRVQSKSGGKKKKF